IVLLHIMSLCRVDLLFIIFFFFSSRRRHTRCYRDWSSDVCSSDLRSGGLIVERRKFLNERGNRIGGELGPMESRGGKPAESFRRSEERRVGKEGRSRRWGDPNKKEMKERQGERKEARERERMWYKQ